MVMGQGFDEDENVRRQDYCRRKESWLTDKVSNYSLRKDNSRHKRS